MQEKEIIVVIIVLAFVLIGGEVLFVWVVDRLAPDSTAPLWKRALFFLTLLIILAIAIAATIWQNAKY